MKLKIIAFCLFAAFGAGSLDAAAQGRNKKKENDKQYSKDDQKDYRKVRVAQTPRTVVIAPARTVIIAPPPPPPPPPGRPPVPRR